MAGRFVESGIETSIAFAQGMTSYWSGALARGLMPWDVANDALRWWDAMADRRVPDWSSPNEVVLGSPIARLRDFSQGSRARVVPTLVLPPQAGHHSCIVDYSVEQSQIDTIRGAGLERVFSMEWVGAGEDTKHAVIEDYIEFLDRSLETIGSDKVNLVGDCQGGWLAAIYAALRPERI